MAEIDMEYDEYLHQERLLAEERGDKKHEFKITLREKHPPRFHRPLVHTEEGTTLVRKGATRQEVDEDVMQSIKYSNGLVCDYEVLESSYSPEL